MNKLCLAFDLDDTLTYSKQNIDKRMASLLSELSSKYTIAIISGCNYEQMQNQVVYLLDPHSVFNFHFLPTSGGQYWHANKCIYFRLLDENEIAEAQKAFWISFNNLKLIIPKLYGYLMENRESQLTFSMCGQNAPLKVKEEWNKKYDQKRRILAECMQELLPNLTVRVGGKTSIDVTPKGLDKAFGLGKFLEYTKFNKEEILFFGDQLQPGGNDYSVKQMGIDCVEVSSPEDTFLHLSMLRDL